MSIRGVCNNHRLPKSSVGKYATIHHLFQGLYAHCVLLVHRGIIAPPLVQVQFSMRRKAYWYTINIVIPSQIMWVMCYSSLYIRPDASPARVSLVVLSILTLITLSNRAFDMLPIVSEPVWITDYLFILNILCCAHLAQFILLHSALRAQDRRKKRKQQQQQQDALCAAGACGDADCRTCGANVVFEPITAPPQPNGAPPNSVASTTDSRTSEEVAIWTHIPSIQELAEAEATTKGRGKWSSWKPKLKPRCDETCRSEALDFLIEFGCHLDGPSRVISPVAFIITTMIFYFSV